MLAGGLCWIIRTIELLNHKGVFNMSFCSDKRQLVAIMIFLTGGGGFLFGVCGMARYIQFAELYISLCGGCSEWISSTFGGQFILTILGAGAAGLNCLIAIVQIKKSGQVQ
ncbi:hypothetical protein ACHWQZ_G015385 [Mnemiopsis leidyi]